ncbi:MAG: hypothetical protein IPN26_16445 [Bacteroidetes bacterium]|nr:hypothetical protein [Bacteroidota bacterium]
MKHIGTIYVKDRLLYQGSLQFIGDSLGRILNKENKEIAEYKMDEKYTKAMYLKFLNRHYWLLKLNKNEKLMKKQQMNIGNSFDLAQT